MNISSKRHAAATQKYIALLSASRLHANECWIGGRALGVECREVGKRRSSIILVRSEDGGGEVGVGGKKVGKRRLSTKSVNLLVQVGVE